jgi:hypothetical protein
MSSHLLKLIPNWRLVPNARRVLRYAWSIRLMVISFVFSGAEIALPLLDGILPVPRLWFAGISFVAAGGAFVARLVAQESVSGGRDGE